MAARIRLRNISSTSKGRYNFRIVVLDGTKPRDGKEIEVLGHYSPTAKQNSLKFNSERYEYWLQKGAKASDTIASLYKKFKKNPQ